MSSTGHIVRMTSLEYNRLQTELATLRAERGTKVPDGFVDCDASSIARHSERQARICEIENVLTTAVVGEEPVGDLIAEPGMVLTIRYDAIGETETFLLGRRGAEDADIKVYSMASPLGRAIAGARPGEQRIYSIPHERGLLVTLLGLVPRRMTASKHPRSHSAAMKPNGGRRQSAIARKFRGRARRAVD